MKTFKNFIKRYGWRCFTWRILIFPIAVLGYLISTIGTTITQLCFVLVGDYDQALKLYQGEK
jgi:hypothetical protein